MNKITQKINIYIENVAPLYPLKKGMLNKTVTGITEMEAAPSDFIILA